MIYAKWHETHHQCFLSITFNHLTKEIYFLTFSFCSEFLRFFYGLYAQMFMCSLYKLVNIFTNIYHRLSTHLGLTILPCVSTFLGIFRQILPAADQVKNNSSIPNNWALFFSEKPDIDETNFEAYFFIFWAQETNW